MQSIRSRKRTLITGLAALPGLCAVLALPALAQEKVLRIGMTAADIPKTTG